ncbi:cyclin-dependent kinase [Thraustotheca clavata]|uniref:Cyclin-dependent kinase 2 homolog n=1 Tax=Thraustotheca clavata TaxID=74557 RepID=A0A1V9ZZE1_9STRA|nr:cyclin-dependent kinase [Thraustotheca clavata]
MYGTADVDKYEKVRCVGSGTYGCVYEAKNKETGEIVAMKKIKTLNEAEGIPITTLREISALRALRHPNLVQLKEVVVSKQKDDDDEDGENAYSNHKIETGIDYASGSIYLVLEFVPHDLTGLLKSTHVLTEVAIKYIMKQLLEALHYMHQRDLVHRDIKCSNILVTAEHQVKLADYGLARTARTHPKFTNKVVTLWYRAPELLLGATDYDASVDMWSAGCVMAELFLGHPIFPGKVEADQMTKIIDVCGNTLEDVNGISHLPHFDKFIPTEKRTWQLKAMLTSKAENRKRSLPKGFLDLLANLLTIDPKKRYTAKQALQSEYFFAYPQLQDLNNVTSWIPPIQGENCHEMSTRKNKKENGAHAILSAAELGKKKALDEKAHNLMSAIGKNTRPALPPAQSSTGAMFASKLGLKKEIKSSPNLAGLAKRMKPAIGDKNATPSKPRPRIINDGAKDDNKKPLKKPRKPLPSDLDKTTTPSKPIRPPKEDTIEKKKEDLPSPLLRQSDKESEDQCDESGRNPNSQASSHSDMKEDSQKSIDDGEKKTLQALSSQHHEKTSSSLKREHSKHERPKRKRSEGDERSQHPRKRPENRPRKRSDAQDPNKRHGKHSEDNEVSTKRSEHTRKRSDSRDQERSKPARNHSKDHDETTRKHIDDHDAIKKHSDTHQSSQKQSDSIRKHSEDNNPFEKHHENINFLENADKNQHGNNNEDANIPKKPFEIQSDE